MSGVGNLSCAEDAQCLAINPNSICSPQTSHCTCNPWYGWEGPECNEINTPGSLLLIGVWGVVVAISIIGIAFGTYDFRRAYMQHIKDSFKSTKRRTNAAMITTLAAILALVMIMIWGVFSIISVVIVIGTTPEITMPSELLELGTYGRFEVVTTFVAPLSIVAGSLSLMRTSFLWIEIAARSRSLRPVLGATFRRTHCFLLIVHVLFLAFIGTAWGLGFLLRIDYPRFSMRLLISAAAIPPFLIVIVSFCVGSARLKAIFVEARKSVYDERTSNDQSAQANGGGTGRKSIAAFFRRRSKSRSSNDSGGEYKNRSVSNDNADVPASRRVSDGMVILDTASRMKSGASDFASPPPQGGNAIRAARWNRHANLVHQTSLLVCLVILLGVGSLAAVITLEFLFGWRNPPRIAGRVSWIVVAWLVGPLCLVISQLLILRYIHIASSKIKQQTGRTNNLSRGRYGRMFLFPPRRGSKDRNESLVAFDQAVAVNPGFQVEAENAGEALRKHLSHIREDPNVTSANSQYLHYPDASSHKHSNLSAASLNQDRRNTGLFDERRQHLQHPQEPFPAAIVGGGSFVSSFGSFIAEKQSEETESADSMAVLVLDNIPPPPPYPKTREMSYSV